MKIPIKEDFYINSGEKNDVDRRYAVRKFLGKNHKDITEYIKTYSVYGFLETISHIGIKAFVYYLDPILSYVKTQSKYWDDDYDNFDGRDIDDHAPLAYGVLPREIGKKIDEYPDEMKKSINNNLLDFCQWAILNHDNFNKECFVKENIKKEYIDLIKKIKDMNI